MSVSVVRGLVLGLVLSFAALADAADTLPCQPDAQCALRMAREAAAKRALAVTDDSARRRALNVILWTASHDRGTDPQSLQPMFKSLRARIDSSSSAQSRPRELSRLARVMASYGLVDEARLLAGQLGNAGEIDGVNVAAVGFYARRGRVREAFEIIKALPKDGAPFKVAMDRAINGIASTGQPELAREIPKDLPGSDPTLISGTIILALAHAGQHDAARAEAQKLTDGKARMAALLLLYNRHKGHGPREQFLPTARALYRSILDMPLTAEEREKFPAERMRKEATRMLLEAMGENEHEEELALIAQLPVGDRERQLKYLVGYLRTSEQVSTASKLIAGLPGEEREELEAELLTSRIRVGEFTAAEALKKAEQPPELFDALIQLTHEYARANNTARARELIQAVVAHMSEYQGDMQWASLAQAQIAAGLLSDAAKTIDERVEDPPFRVSPLLALSIAQAKAGQKAQAGRTLAQAEKEYQSFAEDNSRMGGLAMEYLKLEMFDEAEAELRRHVAAKAPRRDWQSLATMIASSRARSGNVSAALEFARYLSANLGDSPEPFVRIYTELDPVMEPTDGELPWAPIRADMDMLNDEE